MNEKEDRPKQDQPSQEAKTPPEGKPLLTVTAPEFEHVKAQLDLDPIKLGPSKSISPMNQDRCSSNPDTPSHNLKAPEFIEKLASETPPVPPKKQKQDADPKE
ncbi:MAG: hypothetical protein WC443_12095 [Desulfobaccales bacterium]